MPDKTSFEHAAIAVVMQGVIFLALVMFGAGVGNVSTILAAALPPVFFFFAREHAQRQKWLEKKANGGLKGWPCVVSALRFWEWDRDSKLDLALPVVAVSAVSLLWILCCWLL
jgi:hypothetical protein